MTARDDLREAAERIAVGTAMSYDQARAMLGRALKAENNVLPTRRNPARDDLADSILRAEGYVKMPSREAVRLEVEAVLFNASNYPRKVQARILGTDTGPLTAKVTDAILALLAGEVSE